MKTRTPILIALATLMLFTGCTLPNPDADLDNAYSTGQLSGVQYFQLKQERQAQRLAQAQQAWQNQQQQQQDIENERQQTINQLNYDTSQMSDFLLRNTPVIQPHQSSAFPNFQANPNLPTAIDAPSDSDIQTGLTQIGKDGRLWYQYRTASGYLYWKLAQ